MSTFLQHQTVQDKSQFVLLASLHPMRPVVSVTVTKTTVVL